MCAGITDNSIGRGHMVINIKLRKKCDVLAKSLVSVRQGDKTFFRDCSVFGNSAY